MNLLNWSRPAGIALSATIITVCASNLRAADWSGVTDSDWNTATNWVGDAVPASSTAAIQSASGNIATISADSTFTPSEIIIGGGSATGRLDHTAGTMTTINPGWPPGWMLVGNGASGNATYNLADTTNTGGTLTGFGLGSGSITIVNSLFLGEPGGSDEGTGVSMVNVNTSGGMAVSGDINVGVSGWSGTMNLDAGAVTGGNLHVGRTVGDRPTAGVGNLNISGGSVTLVDRLNIGVGVSAVATSANVGTVTLSGGTLKTDNTHDFFWAAGVNMASGAWNGVNGSGIGGTGGSATINLDGGILSTLYLFSETRVDNMGTPEDASDDVTYTKGTSTFYFNGGTLQAQANRDVPWAPFLGGWPGNQSNPTDPYLTAAYVKAGGAVIDSNGNNIMITQPLLGDPVSTDGGLTKNGAGQLELRGQNTFTGEVVVNEGTLFADVGNGSADRAFSFASGITVNSGATLKAATNSLFGWNGSQAKPITVAAGATAIAQYGDQNVGLVTLNGGTLTSLNPDPSWGSWNFGRAGDRSLVVTEDSAVTAESVGFQNGAMIEVAAEKTLTFSGTITDKPDGVSSLNKWGDGTLVLSGANTYTGNTSIYGGTLEMSSPTLGDSAVLYLYADWGAVLNLSHTDTDVVDSLVHNDVQLAAGLYRAADENGGSGDGTVLVGLKGAGKLQVTNGPPSAGYADWATANVGDEPSNVDTDLDGVSNGMEYFMNSEAGFTGNPGPDGTNMVTWPNGAGLPVGDYGVAGQYVVEKSTDLVTWVPVPDDGSDTNLTVTAGAVSYTINGADKQFVRLKVTPN